MYIKIFEWHPVHHVGQHLLHFKTKTKVYFVSVIFNLMNNLDPLSIVLTQTSTQPDAVHCQLHVTYKKQPFICD